MTRNSEYSEQQYIKGFVAAWYYIGALDKRYLIDILPEHHEDYLYIRDIAKKHAEKAYHDKHLDYGKQNHRKQYVKKDNNV